METNEQEVIKTIVKESSAPTYTFEQEESPEQKRAHAETMIPKDFVPDLRSLGRHQDGFATELGSSDADKIKQAIEAAKNKPVLDQTKTKYKQPVVHTIAGYRVSHPLPDDSRIGWTSFSKAVNPGGALGVLATEPNDGLPTDDLFQELVYDQNWKDYGVIFLIGISFWSIVQLGFSGISVFIICLLFIGSYFELGLKRLKIRTTDDIKREFAKVTLESSKFENVEWLNSFIQRFWLIFEPLLSAYVIENIDTYLVDYLPGFLDSVRLTTFTLGSKPFRVDHVKSFTDTKSDTVCMDWAVSFTPDDCRGMTDTQVKAQVSPKVVLNIRLGKGFVGTAFPVLVEDMSFQGRLRIKIQFMSKMPHIRVVKACFLEKPVFDYVLKPLGGETFGFDVNNIPGLQGFVRDQAHAILGPMLYHPNEFMYDVEKFFSGELDINRANGVLAITVHSCSKILASDTTLNPFIRFYLDKAQELEKTAVCEDTRTPHWNETRFLLLNNLDSMLTMELRTTNNTKKAGKRLARAHFDLKEMKEEEDMKLDNLELPMQRNGKFITNLHADMRYFPVSKQIKNPDGTYLEPAPSNSGVLRVTIHECKNLGSNKMNPFATIKINGIDRFETPTFKRTPNPKFERSFEILVLDRTEVYIRVSITDRINFAGDASLGAWNGYLVDIMRDQEENDNWWTLKKQGRDTNAKLKFSVQWEPVVMDGLAQMGGAGIYTPPIGVIRFSIWSANDLMSRSVGSNRQDPYVRIKSGKQIRARTEMIENTENPEWGEFLYVPVHSMHEDLVLEVMNYSSSSKDKALGSTLLHMKDIIVERKRNNSIWFDAAVEKYDKTAPLLSGNSEKGALVYTAEFYPTMTLPEKPDDDEIEYNPMPIVDLHQLPVRYTPDDLIDLGSYSSGVLTVKIHEIKASQVYECYCQLMVDALKSQHKTETLKGRVLAFNETSDAFIKDAGFSRVAIEVKPVNKTEKDDDRLAYWYESSERIIRSIQKRARQKRLERGEPLDGSSMLVHDDEDEGEWYDMINPVSGPAKIRLSFGYAPLLNYKVNPDESLENQGILTVTLLNAKHLKAVDKTGTSDPFVKFIINGEIVYKSAVIKKTLNPVWRDEKFEVPIISRVTASFRIEVFDWNQILGDEPLGSGGMTIRGDMVESFTTRECDIPLDGAEAIMGSCVRVRLKWEPQLLMRRKTQTSFLSATRSMTSKMGTTAFDWSQPPKNTLSTVEAESKLKSRSIQSKLSNIIDSTSSTKSLSDAPASQTCRGLLTMYVVEARDLKGDIDRLHPQTANPYWNESFSQELSGEEIRFELKLRDAHTFHSYDVGMLSNSLWDFIRPPIVTTFDKWIPLEPPGSGEVHLKISYAIKDK
ncbi:hypothetical protein HPULCUR_008244 [Helicostylum pulchrum]|uniref:Uncharacterized protein n=1 Tax=Helicostylum pulchrum TaxID=562976 RepID=A0ABP9Y713_9FUNG